jgi:alkanesulfonate monooxygenase SsuD/methylene tetrahydromethanopterin reductase-like flavin-dependent oxidoreductase (luciferase family)
MEIGAHLPLMDFGGDSFTLDRLRGYAKTAVECGFSMLAANDHLLFDVPWLDGPTALAAVLSEAEGLTLATTVALPVVRGPVVLAKSLTAIDLLSGGRLVVAVGPGSSPADHAAGDGSAAPRPWAQPVTVNDSVISAAELLPAYTSIPPGSPTNLPRLS